MKRALTPLNLLQKKITTIKWSNEFADAFDNPATTGVWFIWGNSGNGKTSFLLQLAKQFAYQKQCVLFNSREEGDSDTIKRAFEREAMHKVNGHLLLVDESVEDLTLRLRKQRSPKIVIIDTIQYCRFTNAKFFDFVSEFEKTHLIIFNSQAKGSDPRGSIAETAKYHASLKIWVEGFRAISHGRYFGTVGHYDIWPQRAAEYWLDPVKL